MCFVKNIIDGIITEFKITVGLWPILTIIAHFQVLVNILNPFSDYRTAGIICEAQFLRTIKFLI